MTTRAKVSAACATVVLAVAGLATAYDREPPDLGMTIDEVRTEWPPVVGGNVPTFVTLTNRTPRPVRLLGNHVMACGNNVCYAAKFFPPKALAPGESVVIEYDLMPRAAGPYSAETTLFVYRDGQIQYVPVAFTGTTLPAPEQLAP